MSAGGAGGAGAVRAAGRGGAAVLGAKAFFIIIGFAQQTLLPPVIGLAGYGALSRVMAVANIVNNVVVASSIQGVSRSVAGARGRERGAFRDAMRVHAPVAIGAATLFALSTPALAAFQGAPHIRAPLAVMAAITLAYGFYAPLVGALNGRARFGRQAALDATAATLRTAGLVGVGALFVARGADGPLGAAFGAAVAAVAMLPIALRAARLPDSAAPADAPAPAAATPATYARQLGSLAAAQLFTSALMQIDLWLLGRYLSQAAPTAVAADEWVGVYRACQLFAFLPFQLLMSVSQVLFPMVARARAEGDPEAVRRWVARGMRVAMLAAGLMVGVVVALPGPILGLAFGPVVAERGASTLRVLALGQGAFTLFGVAGAVLASLGRERATAAVSLSALALVAAGCALTVPGAGFGEAQLRACAAATSAALGLALASAAIVVRREAGAFVPWMTAARAGAALAAALAVGSCFPSPGKIGTLVAAAACAATYVVVLIVTGELGKEDVAAVRAIASRRG